MKRLAIYIGVIILFSVIGLLVFNPDLLSRNNQLVYESKQSFHHEFYFEDGYLVFRDEIMVKNTTSKDLYFYMSADVSEDAGLAAESTAFACGQNSLEKEKFFIKVGSEQVYMVYFKAEKGVKDTKSNRLPPKQITFEIID